MEITVLIADDDTAFRELLEDILRKENYRVLSARDGAEALEIFWAKTPEIDLVILDVMMPQYSGWEVLKEIRTQSEVPVLMLTALEDEESEINGLTFGADDYITKPFKYKVFLARVYGLTRKVRKQKETELVVEDILIEQAKQQVFIKDKEIILSKKEYYLLLCFIRNKNLLLTREQLLNHVWGYDYMGDIRTVDTHIKTLRAKLGESGKFIKTLRGRGYQFRVE